MSVDTSLRGCPGEAEHIAYYGQYIALVPDGDIIAILERQIAETERYFAAFSADEALWRPEPAEWNALQVAGHLVDAERLLMHRAFKIARGDETPWESFEPELYVDNGGFEARALVDVTTEWAAVRAGTLALLRVLDNVAWARRMPESFSVRSVRAFAYTVAGHVTHHILSLQAQRAEAGPSPLDLLR